MPALPSIGPSYNTPIWTIEPTSAFRARALCGRCPTRKQNTCKRATRLIIREHFDWRQRAPLCLTSRCTWKRCKVWGSWKLLWNSDLISCFSKSGEPGDQDLRRLAKPSPMWAAWRWLWRIASPPHSGTCRISAVWGEINHTWRFAKHCWHCRTNLKTFQTFLLRRFSVEVLWGSECKEPSPSLFRGYMVELSDCWLTDFDNNFHLSVN